jgi:hypothetical protein
VTVTPSPSSVEAEALRFVNRMTKPAIRRLCVFANQDGEDHARTVWVHHFEGANPDPPFANAVFDEVMTRC